jgi:cobalt-zinc-cadmium efflux system membrane fusion protein
MPIRSADVRDLSPADLARRTQFLGLPDPLAAQLSRETASSNLIAVTAPFDGEVVARSAAAGEAADPARSLFVVADTSRMWLTLRVRVEDARRLRVGQPVRFRHADHADDSGADAGTVAWVSPAADETTRTVAVRVDLPNAGGRHRANTFGTGRVILREEPAAIVVPSAAVHWEGDCNIVFVKDKNFDQPDGPRVFHVRTVRPGVKNVTATGSVTEVIAGVLPGEWVAVQNSGFLRSELLKNSLGEG